MTNLPPPLNPPVRVLMGPGPSDIHPRVLQAMGKPTVGHLDPYYLTLMDHMQQMLRDLFRTKNRPSRSAGPARRARKRRS
jgi:alanine-glyoxylate transaminase/serine-glyoxylate transaminase/serine-pyruvate transaminase